MRRSTLALVAVLACSGSATTGVTRARVPNLVDTQPRPTWNDGVCVYEEQGPNGTIETCGTPLTSP